MMRILVLMPVLSIPTDHTIDAHHWTAGMMAGNVVAASYPGHVAVKFLAYNYVLVECDAM